MLRGNAMEARDEFFVARTSVYDSIPVIPRYSEESSFSDEDARFLGVPRNDKQAIADRPEF